MPNIRPLGVIVLCLARPLACDTTHREPAYSDYLGSGSGSEPNLFSGGASDADTDIDPDIDSDTDVSPDAGAPDCVLTGDTGLSEGELAPDIPLYACSGEAVRLHQLICDSPYTIVYSFSEW